MTWQLLPIPSIHDPRGRLAVIETLPFPIRRAYYLYDIPAGASRAGHAHRRLQQAMVAVSGSFRVTLNDGQHPESVWLSRPDQMLLLPPMVWRELDHFSAGAVCLVLASEVYDESDYIRDEVSFKEAVSRES